MIETCPACKGQTGPEFTCSICAGTNVYPPDSIFRIDTMALAAQAGYDYNGAPVEFTPMYEANDTSDESTNFWNGCLQAQRRAERVMRAFLGPPTGPEPREADRG